MQFWKQCGILTMVLPINGKRAALHCICGGNSFFSALRHLERRAAIMITYSELFQFCILIVSVISLVIKVCNSKKK